MAKPVKQDHEEVVKEAEHLQLHRLTGYHTALVNKKLEDLENLLSLQQLTIWLLIATVYILMWKVKKLAKATS